MSDPIYIGEHCSFEACALLDFLPITCSYCNKVYCKEHHTPYHHQCKDFDADTVQSNPNTQYRPSEPCARCQVKDLTNVLCEACHRVYCMLHRTLEQHSCHVLEIGKGGVSKEERKQQQCIAINAAKTGVKGVAPKRKGAKSAAIERKVMLMKMKNKSQGPNSIPFSERLFINVIHGDNTTKSNTYFHFSTTWSVGLCIDVIADHLKLRNNNNRANADVLTMQHNGSSLVMSNNLSEFCESGDTVSLVYVPPS